MRVRPLFVSLVGLAVWTVSAAAQPQTMVLRFGRIWDGTKVTAPAVVVIEGARIVAVGGSRTAVPKGATVIDLGQSTGLPGLVDLHTHMTYYWDPASGTTPLRQPRRDPSLTVEFAKANALRTLESGVTTVRDLGASSGMDYAMRDAINTGTMIGPRMFEITARRGRLGQM